MEEEKKANNTKYILRPSEEESKQKILNLLKMPLKAQRYVFFNSNDGQSRVSNLGYSSTAIVDNDEKLHVISRRHTLMINSKGTIFLKSGNPSVAATYKKSGRSSTRLSVWGHKRNLGQFMHEYEFKLLVNEVNPQANALIENKVVKDIMTKGLIGSILAGKITTPIQAVEHRITYALRGIGLQKADAEALYYFYNEMGPRYICESILHTCLDPRAVIYLFHPILGNEYDRKKLISDTKIYAQQFMHTCPAIDEKIDWVNKDFNPKAFLERISKKEKGIKDMLHLWDGGPVLKRKASPVSTWGLKNQNDDLPF